MSDNIGARVELEGEAAYREAIRGINAELKVNYSEMGLVAAQYDTASDSQDALKAKSTALAAAMETQAEKVKLLETRGANMKKQADELAQAVEKQRARTESLRAAYEDEAAASGKSSEASRKLKAEITEEEKNLQKLESQQRQNQTATAENTTRMNQAATQLQEMQNQQDAYTDAMDRSGESGASLADVVNGIADAMGVQLPPAAQAAINQLEGVSASGAAAATAVAAIVIKLGQLSFETSKTADDLLTLSAQTGLTTDQLQEFEYASELIDVSTSTLQGSLTKLTNNMQTAATGSGSAAEAFAALGVSVTDSSGGLRDNYDVFLDTIDALGQVENGTQRDALAMDIFGKSATDLNPLILAGSDRLRELAQEAHETGYVMGGETLQNFGALDDATQRLDKKFDTVKNTLAEALLPVLTALVEIVDAVPAPVLAGIAVAGGVVTVVLLIAKALRDAAVASALMSAANVTLGVTGAAATVSMSALLVPLLAVAAIVGVVAGGVVAYNNYAKAKTTAATAATGTSIGHNAKGTRFWTGGPTEVGEDGPEIVDLPRGSRIYPNGQVPRGGNTNVTYYVTIDAKNVREFNDIVKIAQNQKTSMRQGVVVR